MNARRIVTGIAIAGLAIVLNQAAIAQQSLVDWVRDGKRDSVLAAITSPDVDVNAAAPDGATALHWATYQVDHELVRALLDAGAEADVTNAFGSTPLAEAVKLGDVELVRMLLDAGADPDSPNQDNQTMLMLASNIGVLEIAELLVEHGADVNAVETFRGQNALMWAAGQDHPDIVDLLLAHGADADLGRRAVFDDWPRQMTSEPRAQFRQVGGMTALLYATRSGCYRCAVAIVEAGADVDQPSPEGITPLLNAIDNRRFDIAMYLLDQGARPDVWDMHGRTPLYMAIDTNSFLGGGGPALGPGDVAGGNGGAPPADRGQEPAIAPLDIARRLIGMGVDVNHQLTRMRPNGPARGRFSDYMMRGGTGPLLIAAMAHDHDAIELLLANGAEVDLANVFRITPLMAAAGMSGTGRGTGGAGGQDPQATAIRTIDLLLDAGADINAQVLDSRTNTAQLDTYVQGVDNEGKTALHAAAERGAARMVEHLLARGADPSIRDANGNTPLDLAEAGGGRGGRGGRGGAPGGAGRGGEPVRSAADVLRDAR